MSRTTTLSICRSGGSSLLTPAVCQTRRAPGQPPAGPAGHHGRRSPGAHAHAAFGIPVIGVAKTRFRTATHAVEVLRGRSARPLFVTAAGMPAAQAASLVRRMAGPFRLPDALRRADALARTGHNDMTAARPENR